VVSYKTGDERRRDEQAPVGAKRKRIEKKKEMVMDRWMDGRMDG